MELVRVLSKIVTENLNVKKILLEYPESTVKKLVDKFSSETEDTEDIIKKTISDFERFKSAFDNEDKDIFKHSYDKVKQLVADKSTKQKTKKDLEGLAQEFVTKYKGVDLQLVKSSIKKYFELKTLFPEQKLFKREGTKILNNCNISPMDNHVGEINLENPPLIRGVGYDLYFNKTVVSGADAIFFNLIDSLNNCKWNTDNKPNVEVACKFQGETIKIK